MRKGLTVRLGLLLVTLSLVATLVPAQVTTWGDSQA